MVLVLTRMCSLFNAKQNSDKWPIDTPTVSARDKQWHRTPRNSTLKKKHNNQIRICDLKWSVAFLLNLAVYDFAPLPAHDRCLPWNWRVWIALSLNFSYSILRITTRKLVYQGVTDKNYYECAIHINWGPSYALVLPFGIASLALLWPQLKRQNKRIELKTGKKNPHIFVI